MAWSSLAGVLGKVASVLPDSVPALDKAFQDEVKAAFAAFCLNVASTDDIEDAAHKFGRRLANTKAAYERAAAILKTEFSP